ncbi:MAG: response regulator [Patescibacteria group bacterium]
MAQKAIKILIVDDDEMVRGIYADVFKKEGFEVVEANDGLEGLEATISLQPDVVFTGIIMPRMDGFTLMQELKKNALTSNIPVVFSSHLGREEDKARALELGAKDFFIKDFDTPKEVAERVKILFSEGIFWLSLDAEKLDGPKIKAKLEGMGDYKCSKCQGEVALHIRLTNLDRGEFSGKFGCPKCD